MCRDSKLERCERDGDEHYACPYIHTAAILLWRASVVAVNMSSLSPS